MKPYRLAAAGRTRRPSFHAAGTPELRRTLASLKQLSTIVPRSGCPKRGESLHHFGMGFWQRFRSVLLRRTLLHGSYGEDPEGSKRATPKASKAIEDCCPACRAATSTADRYLSPDLNPGIENRCSTGLPPLFLCGSCGQSRAIPLPAIYDDPAHDLLVFVCTEDSETLINDFHDMLESCRDVMGEAPYDYAWRRPFQITVGWGGLSRILSAVRNQASSPVIRLRPKLEASIYENMFLRAAQANEAAGRAERAFKIIIRSAAYPIYSFETLRTLAHYAAEQGFTLHARAITQEADAAATRSRHIWEQILVSGGAVTHIPEDVQLPRMQSGLERAYDLIRPEGYLSSEVEAEVCGLASGFLEQAIQEFGETFVLGVNLMQARDEIEDLLSEAAENDRERLVNLFTRARNEAKATP